MKYLSNLQTGVQVIDSEMRYVFVNDHLLQQIGKKAGEIIHKKMEEVFPGIENTEIYCCIQDCLINKKKAHVYNEFVFPDGKVSYWQLDLECIQNEVIIFSRDITDLKEGQALLAESNERLEKEVVERTKKLEGSNARLQNLIGHIAHDIRNPLTNIFNLSGFLTCDDEENKNLIAMIRKVSANASNLVNLILEQAALGTGKITLDFSEVNFGKFIQERIDLFTKSKVLSQEYLITMLSDQVLVKIDPIRMSQVIDNMLTNCVRYSMVGAPISITLSHKARFTVINSIDKEKIREAKRSSNTKNSCGFGQEIIRTVLELHHSTLEVQENEQTYKVSFVLEPISENA